MLSSILPAQKGSRETARTLYGHLGEEEIKRLLPQTDTMGLEAAASCKAEPGLRTCLGELGAIRRWLPARPSPAAAEIPS